MDVKLKNLIRTIPKAELHIHLEGVILPSTTSELAHKYDQFGYVENLEAFQKQRSFNDFADFYSYYHFCSQLIRSSEDFSRVVYECGQDMNDQNIRYREIYISIYQHLHVYEKNLSIQDIFTGLENGRQRAQTDFDVEMRWIFGIPRRRHFIGTDRKGFDPTIAKTVLKYAACGSEYGVIGIGLGGNEIGAPPEPFEEIFKEAKDYGLHSIPHAGETEGPKSVWGAINALGADRIGHGVRSVEDISLVNELKDRKIPLDVCPTSNISINLYSSMKEHPIFLLDNSGVIVTINSDDPSIFGSSLIDEYYTVATEFNYSFNDLVRFAKNSINSSFAPKSLKNKYHKEMENWIDDNETETQELEA